MRMNDLLGFTRGELDTRVFLSSIRSEVGEYIARKRRRKPSATVYFDDETSEGEFTELDLMRLLSSYEREELLEWELEYVLSALDLTSHDKTDRTEEVIFALSSPEINYPITIDNIRVAIEYLTGKRNSLDLFSPKEMDPLRHYRTVFDRRDTDGSLTG
jgi:hypothetical protein